LPRSRQLKESAQVLRGLHAHDEALQLLASILADDIAAERVEISQQFLPRSLDRADRLELRP
jgi:hypothetical protein